MERRDFKRLPNEIHENATKCLKEPKKRQPTVPMLRFQSHAQSIRGYKSNNRSTNCIVLLVLAADKVAAARVR